MFASVIRCEVLQWRHWGSTWR